MSGLLPARAGGRDPERDHPAQLERALTPSEVSARWEVRAAAWRARELAESVFGEVESALYGLRVNGPIRGLVRLDVRFVELDAHLDREDRFRALVALDPILSRVPLVYVVGPRAD